jgi:alpha,alpha-trehalose phosphorylase
VDIGRDGVCYSVRGEDPLEIVHDGEKLTVRPDEPVRCELAPTPDFPEPGCVPGREPSRHRARA